MQQIDPPAGFTQTPSGLLVPTPLSLTPATIARTPIIDDDGSGETGTSLDNAWKQEFYGQIDAALAANFNALLQQTGDMEILDGSAGGTVTLSPLYNAHMINCSPAAGTAVALTWTGGSGKNGEVVFVTNRSSSVVRIAQTANILNFVGTAPTPIALQGYATWRRQSGAYWVMAQHEQGAWITPTFNAANFIGTGSMVWTVATGNMARCAYRLSGREVTLAILITGSTISGTGAAQLLIGNGVWGSFNIVSGDASPAAYAADGSGIITPYLLLQGATTTLSVQKTNVVMTLGSFSVYAQPRFEVS